MFHKKKKKEPLKLERVSGLQSEKDLQEALETIVSSFPKEPRMRQHMEMALWKGPVFNPEHTRFAVVDGHVVSYDYDVSTYYAGRFCEGFSNDSRSSCYAGGVP